MDAAGNDEAGNGLTPCELLDDFTQSLADLERVFNTCYARDHHHETALPAFLRKAVNHEHVHLGSKYGIVTPYPELKVLSDECVGDLFKRSGHRKSSSCAEF